jgi:hypothetical protein
LEYYFRSFNFSAWAVRPTLFREPPTPVRPSMCVTGGYRAALSQLRQQLRAPSAGNSDESMGVGGPENDRPDNLALAMGQTSDKTRAKRRGDGDGDGDADFGTKRAKTSAVCPPVALLEAIFRIATIAPNSLIASLCVFILCWVAVWSVITRPTSGARSTPIAGKFAFRIHALTQTPTPF